MAIDTRNKRASCLGTARVLPNPDGTIATLDRVQVILPNVTYSGISPGGLLINSRNKRSSCLRLGARVYPNPDAAITQPDRQHTVSFIYSGIAASAPVAIGDILKIDRTKFRWVHTRIQSRTN